MARAVGIDVGESRIGIAISDESAVFAQPHAVLSADHGIDKAVDDILEICRQYDVETVVVGMPLSKDGNESGQSAHRSRLVGSRIETALGVEVV